MKHTARQLALVLGVQPSTITRDIKKGRVSATKNARGEYEIDASEIARAYPERVIVDDQGGIAAKGQAQNEATLKAADATPNPPDATPVLQAKLTAAERLLTEREQTIVDLRERLDREGEERRRLTALLTDQSAKPGAPAPKREPWSIWNWFS